MNSEEMLSNISGAMKNVVSAFKNFNEVASKEFGRMAVDIHKATKRIIEDVRPALIAYNSVNPRVRHLALHASKAKVRKKNLNRIKKEFQKSR